MERREFLEKALFVPAAAVFAAVCRPPVQIAKEPTPHEKFHRPAIDGKTVEPQPYLALPFRKNTNYDITEGWDYSNQEQLIHGVKLHAATDLFTAYGTEVLAPADGYAMSSYHAIWVRIADNAIRKWQGKEVGLGLGYFIQMYVPSVNRFVQLAHLSEIDPLVPFSLPVYDKDADHWNPTNHTLTIDELVKHPMVVSVKRGDVLGKVGFSGLRWGKYQEFREGANGPIPLDPMVHTSWDEPHVHFEDLWRSQSGENKGAKGWQRDIFDIYSTYDNYPSPSRNRSLGKEPLLLLGTDNSPLMASD